MTPERAPLLVVGVGNPSRGDDALGPLFLERLGLCLRPEDEARLELLMDFQLQVEHALDLQGRRAVVFVDASVTAPTPFSFEPAVAADDGSATSHALSPAAVLAVYARVLGGDAPPAFVLGIRGERFELGEPLSTSASANLDAALRFFEDWRARTLP